MSPSSTLRVFQGLKALAWLALLVTVGGLVLGGGSMDFPCFEHYDEFAKCMHARAPSSPGGSRSRVEAYLTWRKALWSGGGCSRQTFPNDAFELANPVQRLRVKRNGDSVEVNGRMLAAGQSFEARTWLTIDPWSSSFIHFKNLGVVAYCDAPEQADHLVLWGSQGTEFSPVKGGLILCTLVGCLIYLRRKVRTLGEQVRNAKGPQERA